ncbi:hypothetical protein F8388_014047, partial [Cannabis sativa]
GSSPSPKITITKNISNSIGSSPSPSNFSKSPTQQNNKSQNLNPRRHPQQPSIVEIKRAIGSGRFCDADPKHVIFLGDELEEVKNMKFNVKMMNFPWVFEHPLQKKIQVSAESSTDQIEIKFRLNGQIGLSPLLHKKPQVQIRRWWSRRDCGLTVVKGGVSYHDGQLVARPPHPKSNVHILFNNRLSIHMVS